MMAAGGLFIHRSHNMGGSLFQRQLRAKREAAALDRFADAMLQRIRKRLGGQAV